MDPNLELYRSALDLPLSERKDRLRHLSQAERARVWMIVDREKKLQSLEELIAGRDLVQVALNNPSEIISNMRLEYTLLGRSIYPSDENMMVKRVTNDVARTSQSFIDYVADFDQGARPLPLDAWKLVYCDLYFVDGGSATLQEIYEARLREEELQTPAARARDLVRNNSLKKARRNSKWMIPAIKGLPAEDQCQWTLQDVTSVQELMRQGKHEEAMGPLSKQHEYKQTLARLWKQVSPAPPAWMRHILETRRKWGFVHYLSRQVNQKHGSNWGPLWSDIQLTWTNTYGGRDMADATWMTIHCQGEENRKVLEPLLTEDWPAFQPSPELPEDDDLRTHFKQYVREKDHLLSPGILRNTFIVIPIELIPKPSEDDDFTTSENLDPHWVWAYDADWDGSGEETVVDGETYQGRVKVAKWSISSWFYAARWEGVSLRDMWLKAQKHPEKLWICYIKNLEEWDHEPYV
ncbi:hypothetical protein LB506_011502 [Fusarium annulatum]|uniref:Uncharacterized protein n=2 Tax=Gibberella intermedia TaxID=948311 RepID=A0A365N152_GIBIN|nr:uncharacterized protein FPRO_12548 [Fusarium proliferatum ET1]KAI1055483.1 hypothetical protein LB506_011502 [Fusarium annulatum]RBA14486.1 hypothetical protein FPRO05_03278 [Fusarium proliferatum]RKL32509.1 hypothetical protein BFJ72_g10452 [Fusarium proliferatum]CZR49111.1 uncharacterized protein FPRO_12548 [Fusarium proliferatum ET1]